MEAKQHEHTYGSTSSFEAIGGAPNRAAKYEDE